MSLDLDDPSAELMVSLDRPPAQLMVWLSIRPPMSMIQDCRSIDSWTPEMSGRSG